MFNGKIPHNLEVDHQNQIKTDNRIKNLQLLTHKQNTQKSHNKPIISTCINTGEERKFNSIKNTSIELDISSSNICRICKNQNKNKNKNKTTTSKKDGCKYTFKYLI